MVSRKSKFFPQNLTFLVHLIPRPQIPNLKIIRTISLIPQHISGKSILQNPRFCRPRREISSFKRLQITLRAKYTKMANLRYVGHCLYMPFLLSPISPFQMSFIKCECETQTAGLFGNMFPYVWVTCSFGCVPILLLAG